MKITNFINRNRRDFTAKVICEGCSKTDIISGYDDRYYHDEVLPDIKCKSCNESSITLDVQINPLATRYSDDTIV